MILLHQQPAALTQQTHPHNKYMILLDRRRRRRRRQQPQNKKKPAAVAGYPLHLREPSLPHATTVQAASTRQTQPYYYDNPHVASLMNVNSKDELESLPEPLQVMREYIAQHGVDKQGEFVRPGQKYLRMQYFCPVSA